MRRETRLKIQRSRENRAAHAADVRNRLVNQSVEDAEQKPKAPPVAPPAVDQDATDDQGQS